MRVSMWIGGVTDQNTRIYRYGPRCTAASLFRLFQHFRISLDELSDRIDGNLTRPRGGAVRPGFHIRSNDPLFLIICESRSHRVT